MEGYPDRLAFLEDGWVHVQPVHIPVIRVLSRRERHQFSIQGNIPRGTVGIGDRHQVEATPVHGGWKIQLAVAVVGIEEVFPVRNASGYPKVGGARRLLQSVHARGVLRTCIQRVSPAWRKGERSRIAVVTLK